MTYTAFYNHICDLPTKVQNRELITYLLALLFLVEKRKNEKPDAAMLLEMIQTAFSAEPMEFNENWLDIEDAPDSNIMSRKFTNPEFNSEFDKSVASDKTGIEFTLQVIKFQIAELYKMKDKQLKEEMRYFGIDSETGNRWYNFDPFTNLECRASCMTDMTDDEDQELKVTWQTLGELLEMGRIYE